MIFLDKKWLILESQNEYFQKQPSSNKIIHCVNERGQLVLLSIYAMGRNSDNFENPESFDPNRWIRNPTTKKPKGFS